MASRYGGHVVSITATVAEYANSGTPGVLAALAEDGLAAATKSLAIECGCYGIRVNAVSPGISQAAPSHDDLGSWPPPLGWPGQVSDVIDGVLFLESSRYITGEILHVGGGRAEGR
jgi:NAD(P)-dependent dehydrogenase (short-subunit alcohol dehydrogenase family)